MKAKKLLSILLAVLMVFSMVSMSVSAEEAEVTAVAQVGEQTFATLAEAVEAAKEGGKVTVLQDITLTDDIDITDGIDVTIEGNGKTITGANGKDVFYVNGGKLTLGEGLNIVAPTDCGIYILSGDVFTSANITKNGSKYSAIQGNGQYGGNVTINGGTITNNVVYADGRANNVAIYWPQSGKLTINGGTITGNSAVRMSGGSLEMNGGTLVANGTSKEYIAANGGSFEETGDALIIDNTGYPSGNPKVEVNGGTFTSNNAKAVGSYAKEDLLVITGFIKGGTFDEYVDLTLLAEGYECVSKDTGYVVGKHNPVAYEAKAATCVENGNEAYTHCEFCNYYYDVKGNITPGNTKPLTQVDPTAHEIEEGMSYDASCTMNGQAEHYRCTLCGQKFNDAEGKVTVTDAELVIPKGHKLSEVKAKAPTCTEAGYEAYQKCSACPNMYDMNGNSITEVPTVPATGHKTTLVPEKAATCTATGVKAHYTCSGCDVLFADEEATKEVVTSALVIEKTAHTPEAARVGVVAATHEAAGYTGDVVCACGEVLIKGEAVAKLEAEVVVAPPAVSEEAHEEVAEEIQSVVSVVTGEAKEEEVKTVVTEETKTAIKEVLAAAEAADEKVVIGADIVAEPIIEEKLTEAELKEFKEATEAIEEKAADLAEKDEEVVVAQYIDISVLVVNRSDDNKVLGNITELEKPVTIDIVVPKELRAEGNKPVVVHYHDGKAEIIEGTYNKETGVLSIEASKFSTYALAVVTKATSAGVPGEAEPSAKPSETPTTTPSAEPTATPAPTTAPTATPAPSTVPATGDESNVFALGAIMAMSAAAAYIVLRKFRKA